MKGARIEQGKSDVPNVPCGVESQVSALEQANSQEKVPNVPCGVESQDCSIGQGVIIPSS